MLVMERYATTEEVCGWDSTLYVDSLGSTLMMSDELFIQHKAGTRQKAHNTYEMLYLLSYITAAKSTQ